MAKTTTGSAFCACGCGTPTSLARQTDRARGWLKGQPIRFVQGHSLRVNRKVPSGSVNPMWKGELASYSALHKWLALHKEKTGVCEKCGKEGRTDFANISGLYLRDGSDYSELCRSCHMKGDCSTPKRPSRRGPVTKENRMAKTKEWRPKRVTSEEERGGGSSDYINLDAGQRFLGYALFDGDPSVDEPGYYELHEHWVNAANRYVPCAGDDCLYCEDGDKPKVRARSLWVVVRDEKGNDIEGGKLAIMNLNWNVIKMLTEMRADGDKIKGVQFRVSRVDDRGNYMLTPKTEKLTATQVKEWLKHKDAPDFDGMVTAQLRRAMEALSVQRAMDDTDEDETPAPAASGAKKKGAAAPAAEPEEEEVEPEAEAEEEPAAGGDAPDEWPDEATELAVTVEEIDEANFILVGHGVYGGGEKVWGTRTLDLTGLEEGDTVALDYFTDDEDDKVATAFEKVEAEEEPASELPDAISGDEFVVTGDVNEANGTIPVKSDELELEFILYVLDGVPVDWDDYTPGTKITFEAEKDIQGDMVTQSVPEVVKAKKPAAAAGGRKTAAAGKGAGGKGK